MQAARIMLRSPNFRAALARRSMSSFAKQAVSPGKYLTLSIPIMTFGLGVWQIQRRSEKLLFLEELEKRLEADPIPLPSNLSEVKDWEYARVKVSGQFDHENEVYISGRLERTSKQYGHLVVTPFKVEGQNYSILVGRGWVPKDKTNPVTRPEGQVKGTVEIDGLIRQTEQRPIGAPRIARTGDMFSRRDIVGMAQLLGTAPVFIDATEASNVPGGPIGGQTRIQVSNDHLTYILTWFTLSICTLLLWRHRYYPRREIKSL